MDTHGANEAAGDAALVEAARAGDRAAFAQIYDRYADRLHDYCWSLLRNREEAADATQDAFVLAAERLGQIRDPSRLRPWLYAVARSQALRRLRARDRMTDKDGEQEMATVADPAAGPEDQAQETELRQLVWDAATGLSERDRSLLDLHLRHGLEGAELGEAMGVGVNHVYVLLSRVRDQVERSLGALLVARMGREDCAELAAVLDDWDGRYSPLIRKRVARHVDGCNVCGDRRRTMVSPLALLGAVPLMPAPVALRDRVLASAVLPGGQPGGPRGGNGDGGQSGGQSGGPPRGQAQGAGQQAGALAEVGGAGFGGGGNGGWRDEGWGGGPPERPRFSRIGVLSLVVLFALLVGGVAAVVLPGFAASDEPSRAAAGQSTEPPATLPETTTTEEPSSSVETTTSVTTTTAPVTTTSTTTTTTTTTTAPPILLRVSPRLVTLRPNAPRGTITMSNPSQRPAAWEAVASDLWFTIDPTGGTIEPGQSATIVVSFDPKGVEPPAEGSVLITWDGGQATVPVTVPAPPTTTILKPRG